MEKIRLLNGWSSRKETLPPSDPLRVYLALPDSPDADLTTLRLKLVADLFMRLARRAGRRAIPGDRPELAPVVVASADPRIDRPSGLWLKVAAPVLAGDISQFTQDEIRLYLLSNAPYGSPIKLGPDTLAGARAAYGRLKDYVKRFQAAERDQSLPNSSKDAAKAATWRDEFYALLCEDLNTPRAIATIWMMLQSDLPDSAKLALLADFAAVLGLSQGLGLPETIVRPPASQEKSGRVKTENLNSRKPGQPEPKRSQAPVVYGFEGRNKPLPGQKKPSREDIQDESRSIRRIMRSQDVRSYLREPDRFDFTISLVAYDDLKAVQTTVESLLKVLPRTTRAVEVIAADMNGSQAVSDYLTATAHGYANFRVVYTQQNLGEAAGRNIAFRQGRGRYLLLLDVGLRLSGDYFEDLWRELAQEDANKPALSGAFPVKLVRQGENLTGFEPAPAESGEVEALDGSALLFRRSLVEEAGFMDEHFRFPYGLGLDYSFSFKDKGFTVKNSPTLSRMVERPANFARPVYGLPEEQQERQRQKNWQLFKRSWQLE